MCTSFTLCVDWSGVVPTYLERELEWNLLNFLADFLICEWFNFIQKVQIGESFVQEACLDKKFDIEVFLDLGIRPFIRNEIKSLTLTCLEHVYELD